MAFQKGKSGNPGGRPKKLLPNGKSLIDVAKEHTLSALECLVEVMGDDKAPAAARVGAASAVLDRGWGRPRQALEHTGDGGGPVQFEDVTVKADEFARRITGLAARESPRETTH